MATMTQAEKNVKAQEQAERSQRIAAEQTRLDRETNDQERDAKSRRVREAQAHRESEYRDAHQPLVAFELEGYRLIVWLGHQDQTNRGMAVLACSAAAKYVTDAFMSRLFTYRTTAQFPEIANWPAHVIHTADLHLAYERGLITIEKLSAESA